MHIHRGKPCIGTVWIKPLALRKETRVVGDSKVRHIHSDPLDIDIGSKPCQSGRQHSVWLLRIQAGKQLLGRFSENNRQYLSDHTDPL